jgi:rod shape-determining protein MreB
MASSKSPTKVLRNRGGSRTRTKWRGPTGALPVEEESAEIRGRNLLTGLPKTIAIASEEICEAISVPVDAIVAAVRDTLECTPPELAGDVMDRGMVLAGGGALLRLLNQRLVRETGIPVHMADGPLMCVAVASGRFLE